jgi:transcription elongation GreA/GreB family factor/very-short-patch-repair endonuclease
VSRARDQLVLVRSIRREDLNENDLKARLIAHFENPMPTVAKANGDIFAICGSEFERDVLRRLIEKQYRVTPQVGSVGFSIDMVVEGADGTRLAIECDGDRFHGPAQWRDDMRRQRILERVGWRFWRCFASNYYRDPDGTIGELIETLTSLGIDPIKEGPAANYGNRYVEHRTSELPGKIGEKNEEPDAIDYDKVEEAQAVLKAGLGDRIILHLKDEKRVLAVKLTESEDDHDRGLLSMASPLGRAVSGAQEGDEIDLTLADGIERTIFVETITSAA